MLPKEGGKPLPSCYQDPDYLAYKELFEQQPAEEVYYSNMNAVFRYIHLSAHRKLHGWWEESKPKGWTIDLGCGTGDHLAFLGDEPDVVEVDMSGGALRAARRRFPGALLIQADVYNLPFRPGSIRNILSIYNLEHLWYLDDALLAVRDVLSDDGTFYVGLPAEGGPLWNWGRALTTHWIYKRKYGFNYCQALRIDHCNTAVKVMRACSKHFKRSRVSHFPFSIVPLVFANLTISTLYKPRVDCSGP